MSVTADQVREKLKAIHVPGGGDLIASGKLSDIAVANGKVFCSITVDADAVKAW